MKKILINMICLTLKFMPHLLEDNKTIYIYEEEISKLNNKNIFRNEVAIDIIESIENDSDERSAIININSGFATLNDYKIMDAYKVNEENIDDINGLLKGKKLFKKSDIKKEANLAVINLIRINEGNGTIFNYKKFKIDIVSNYIPIINDYIFRFKTSLGRNLTVLEIREYVGNIVILINTSIKKINDGIGTKKDYENIGINNIDINLIYNINNYLKDKNIKTPNKVRYEIEKFLSALNKISIGVGTTNNYKAIGLKLDVKRIKVINSIVKRIYERDGETLSLKEILDISESIINNFFSENNSKKEVKNKSLIINSILENEFI